MKRIMLAVALLGGIMLMPAIAGATQDEDLHCPDHTSESVVKVEANDDNDSEADDTEVLNDLVLDVGTLVCVKAGPGNTGIVEADGEMTLQEILFDNGIVDGSGEQGKDVSYYVIYPPVEEPEELEAFVCFEGEIVTFTDTDQAALNLQVSTYLETHEGGVQVLSADAECEEEVVVTTTTTTTAPVTTTTEPPFVETPAAPTVTAAPVAAPLPAAAPVAAPSNTLPRTGSNTNVLMWAGIALILLGGALKLSSGSRNAA